MTTDSSPDSLRARVEQQLAREGERLNGWLEEALGRVTREAQPRLVEAMHYSLLAGGKRLRPALVLAACDALGRSATPATADFACALEMVHTYSLVHDDLPAMDDDDLRRGRPTNHKVYGEALAILAGDALLTDAFGLIALGPGEAPYRLALCGELAFAAGARGMVGGQADDMAGQATTLAQLRSLHARKTGALIRAACVAPARMEGIDEPSLKALTTYGEALGLAFQVTDDLLDVTSTAGALGKQAGKDEAKGKVTFPGLLGIDGARTAARQAVEEARSALSSLPGDSSRLHDLAAYTLVRER